MPQLARTRCAALILLALLPGCNREQRTAAGPPGPAGSPAAATGAPAVPAGARPPQGETQGQLARELRAGQRAGTQAGAITLKVDFDGVVALVTQGADPAKPTKVTALAVQASQPGDRQRLPKMWQNFQYPPALHRAYLKVAAKNLVVPGSPPPSTGDAVALFDLANDDIAISALAQGGGVAMNDPNLAKVPHLQAISPGHGKVSAHAFDSSPFARQHVAARLAFATGALGTLLPVSDCQCPGKPVRFSYASLKARWNQPGAVTNVSSSSDQIYGDTQLTAGVPQGFVDVSITSFAQPPRPPRRFRLRPAQGEKEIHVTLLDLPVSEILATCSEDSLDDHWISHFLWFYTLTDQPPDFPPVPYRPGPPPCNHSDPYCSGGFMTN